MNSPVVFALVVAVLLAAGVLLLWRGRVGRRRIQARAGELKQRADAIAAAADEAFTEYDSDGRLRFATPALAQIAGRSIDSLAAAPFLDYIHPDDRADLVQALTDGGGLVSASYRVLLPDNTIRHIVARWLPRRDAAGRVDGWTAAERDVTSIRQAEEDARHDAALFSAILDVQQAVAAVGLDSDAIRRVMVQRGRELTGADGASIEVVDGDGFRAIAGDGTVVPRVSLDASLSGLALRTGQPQRTDDAAVDTRVDRAACMPFGLRSLLVVPIGQLQESIGVLKVVAGPAGAFGERDARALGLLSSLASTLLGHAAAYEGRQRRLEERTRALQDSEQRFKQLVDAAQEGIWVLDERGVTTYVNQRLLELLGQSDGAMLGRPLLEFVDPTARGAAQQVFAQPNAAAGRLDLRFWRKQGGEVWTIVSTSPILDRRGAFVGTVALVTDITDRKRAEERLQRSAERLRALNDLDQAILSAQSPAEVGRAAVARLRRLVPSHRATVMLFDFQRGEAEFLAGLADGSPIPVGRLPLSRFSATETLRRGAVRYLEDLGSIESLPPFLQQLASDGIRSVLSVPLLVEGEVIGELNLGRAEPASFEPEHRDIAVEIAMPLAVALQHTRLREELTRRTAELERRVAERREALGELTSEFDTVIGALAHDVRGPLRHLDGFTELLLDEHGPDLPSGARHYAERVRDGARELGGIIDQLLRLVRVGRQDLVRRPTELNELVQDVLNELEPALEGRAIGWELEELPVVNCDPALVGLALHHLLDNAVKFTRHTRDACIRVRPLLTDGQAGIAVEDNGAGFRMSHAGALFEPFQRLHPAEEYEGLGIGLAMVKRIAQKHGGRVWAQAEPGHGAVISMTLGAPPIMARQPVEPADSIW
ncbi:MAG TPA: PAS domain S-box protein [Gemmatimonadales bacterium]|nr:PAS domain S-box protein [Gemmatimonadales bacterium]